jgi:hypothetical protein
MGIQSRSNLFLLPIVPFHQMPIRGKECIPAFWLDLDQSSLFYNLINRYDTVNSGSQYVTMVTALV